MKELAKVLGIILIIIGIIKYGVDIKKEENLQHIEKVAVIFCKERSNILYISTSLFKNYIICKDGTDKSF